MSTAEERASRIEARLAIIQRHRDFPALSDQIREVVKISQDEDAALDRLADLVLKNYGLTLRVLRTVNSIHYNRSGQPILSVARAIVLLGVRTVRDLASSFLVLDHYQKRSPELKELMVLSMVTASHGEGLSQWANRVRPEEAFVCGMFRNLGEVLIAYHFPEDYGAILEETTAAGISGGEAALRRLGFGYEELGAAMARHWGMPIVGEAMLPIGTSSALRAVTELGHALTTIVYRAAEPATPELLARAAARYRSEVPVPAAELGELVQSAAAEVRKLFASLGAVPTELTLLNRGEPRAAKQAAAAASAPAPTAAPLVAFGFASIKEARTHLLGEVAAVADGAAPDLNRVLLVLLEAVQRGGPFDRAVLALVDQDKGELRARLALGVESDTLSAAFRLPLGAERGAIVQAVLEREPLFAKAAELGMKDARIAKQLGAAELGILPLVVEGTPIGCFYCDRRTAAGPPDPATLIFLGRVQAAAEQAIGKSRRLAPA